MRKSEIQLHYAMLRHNGQTFRILSTNFPELVPGHHSSDLFGFFGFGSGEFLSPNISGIEDVRVRLVEFPSDDSMFSMTLLAVESNPDFIGFVLCLLKFPELNQRKQGSRPYEEIRLFAGCADSFLGAKRFSCHGG